MRRRRFPAYFLPLYILCLLMVASCSAVSDTVESTDLQEIPGRGNVQPVSPEALPYDGVYPQHEPYGTGVGAMPGRVVWAHDPGCVEWDGSGYWWELSHFDETAIQDMVNDSIASLSGQNTAREGWDVNANLKMPVFAEKECHFSPDSIQAYTALITISLVGLKPVKP